MASTNSALFSGLPSLPHVPGADPSRIAFDAFRLAIAEQVSKSLNVDIEKVYEAVMVGVKGYDANVAIPRFRLGGDPKATAERVAKEFVPNDYISEAASNGTAFVNFNFHNPTLTRLVLHQINQLNHLDNAPSASTSSVSTVQENGEKSDPQVSSAPSTSKAVATGYGTNTDGAGKRMLIDFSSPNIAKPFHAGHLRSTIIGMVVSNVYVANGWDVVKLNYLGDWGKQYGLLAVGFDKYGDEEALLEDPIHHLYKVYVQINKDATAELEGAIKAQREKLIAEAAAKGEKATIVNNAKETVELTMDMEFTRAEEEFGNNSSAIHTAARATFRRMEDGEPEALGIWKKFRDLSIEKYKGIYARLNIEFDIYWGESQVSPALVKQAVEDVLEKKVGKEDQGAVLIDLQKWKLGKTPVRKRDGTALYITRDIAGAYEKYNTYKFDKHIYVVASQQDLAFKQLFKVLELLEVPWAKDLLHVNFGMVTGMSTRKGTVVFLEDILDEAKDVMHKQMQSNEDKYKQIENPEHTSDVIGITAVKIQDMSGKRGNNYEFNWSRMLSFEGDTGPYLQYAHVRLASVERKSAPEVVLPPPAERPVKIDTSLITEPKAREVVFMLASYPDVIKTAFKTLEPSNIVTFAFKLCHTISSAWEVLLVRGQPQEVALARLWLFVSARDVLASALKILSVSPLERM